MTEKNQVYKCEVCGNIVEVLHVGAGDLVCCNQPMILQEENTVDAATEKHVPIIEDLGEGKIRVKVGEVDHPMTEEHKIEWIELVFNEKIIIKGGFGEICMEPYIRVGLGTLEQMKIFLYKFRKVLVDISEEATHL